MKDLADKFCIIVQKLHAQCAIVQLQKNFNQHLVACLTNMFILPFEVYPWNVKICLVHTDAGRPLPIPSPWIPSEWMVVEVHSNMPRTSQFCNSSTLYSIVDRHVKLQTFGNYLLPYPRCRTSLRKLFRTRSLSMAGNHTFFATSIPLNIDL